MPLITNSSCLVAKKDFLQADLKVTRNSLHARLQMIPEQQTFSFPPDFWSVGITWKNEQESFCSLHVLGLELSGRGCRWVYMDQAQWDLEISSWIWSVESAKPNDLFQENKSTLGLEWSRSVINSLFSSVCVALERAEKDWENHHDYSQRVITKDYTLWICINVQYSDYVFIYMCQVIIPIVQRWKLSLWDVKWLTQDTQFVGQIWLVVHQACPFSFWAHS